MTKNIIGELHMKIQFDSNKLKSLVIEKESINWRNERQFPMPHFFSCAQMVPCMTSPIFPGYLGEIYPPESEIKLDYIEKINAISEKNDGKTYDSMDDFLKSLEE